MKLVTTIHHCQNKQKHNLCATSNGLMAQIHTLQLHDQKCEEIMGFAPANCNQCYSINLCKNN